MKRKLLNKTVLLMSSFLLLIGLSACGNESSSDEISSEILSETPSETPSKEPTSEFDVVFTSISEIRDLAVGTVVNVQGSVVSFNYTNQSVPEKNGMYIADETGTIFLYGENAANLVETGYTVYVEGVKDYYIPSTDQGAAPSMNYKGEMQLGDINLLGYQRTSKPVPEAVIHEIDSLSEITSIPLSEDITGTLYRMRGRLSKFDVFGFANYYLHDLNRLDDLLFYTTANGLEFAYLDEYLDQPIELTFFVKLGKPRANEWRLYPTEIVSLTTVSPEEEATYSAYRASVEIKDQYSETLTVSIPSADPLLEGAVRSFSSNDSAVNIELNGDNYDITFNVEPNEIKDVAISITATYEGETSDPFLKTVHLEFEEVEIETTPIGDLRTLDLGTEVTVEGVIGRLTYKSGTEAPLGAFIIDETGSVVIYNNPAATENLVGLSEGNRVIIKGVTGRYVADANNAAANNYLGDFQLVDVSVLYNDSGSNEIPLDSISESSITTIQNTNPSEDISGNIYQVETVVEVIQTPWYATINVKDPLTGQTLNVYSQKNAADFEWLKAYDGQTVTMLLGVQNAKVGASSFSWRVCPVQVID